MEAIFFKTKTREVIYEKNHPLPSAPKEGEVIVKVAYSGLCGTDIHIIKGDFPSGSGSYILGHEFSGVVTQVGPNSQFRVGHRVVVDPNFVCSLCKPCRKGLPQHCKASSGTVGVGIDGGWAEYAKVPEAQVFLLPDTVNMKQGALVEPYSCVTHGFDKASPIDIGQKIMIIGTGIIGNLWIAMLHHHGHKDVTVSEINENRLARVTFLETGFRLVSPEVVQNEDILYDVIIDCTGVGKVMELNFKFLAEDGKYVVFGCSPPSHVAALSTFDIFNKEAKIIGVKRNPFSFPKAIPLIDAMRERYLDYEKLGVKIYKLHQYEEALQALREGKISKATFEIHAD